MKNRPTHNIDVLKFKQNHIRPPGNAGHQSYLFCAPVNATMICDRDSIYECEKNIDVFSSVQPLGLMTILMGQNMMRKDGEAHNEERKTIFKTISPKTSRDYWRNKFETVTDTIIEKIKETKIWESSHIICQRVIC